MTWQKIKSYKRKTRITAGNSCWANHTLKTCRLDNTYCGLSACICQEYATLKLAILLFQSDVGSPCVSQYNILHDKYNLLININPLWRDFCFYDIQKEVM